MLPTCSHSMGYFKMPIVSHYLESKHPYSTSIIDHTNSSHTPNIKNAHKIDHLVGKSHFISSSYQTGGMNLKEMIIDEWGTFAEIFIEMKEAQLALGASVNDVNEVNNLIDNYFVKPEKALEPYLLSTLAFDKDFKIGKKLLNSGAKIESYFLSNLVESVKVFLDSSTL